MTSKDKKHQEFVNQYFICNMNQTEAYLKVYPKSSYDSARANSARLIADDSSIRAEIAARLAELKMSADEVLIRLAEQARGSHADFSAVNLREDLKDHPKAHLVKSIVADVHEDSQGRVHHKIRLELYDAQAALVHIGKAHGLFNNDPGSSDDKPFIVKVVRGVSVDDL
jgi:hypothetical protein